MTSERLEREQKTTQLHLAMEAKDVLQQLEDHFLERPAGIEYFTNVYHKRLIENETLQTEKPIIATMCIQVPEELIYAAGAVPLRICSGSSVFEMRGADHMPAKSCPLIKATLGKLQLLDSRIKEKIAAIVIPATCDQKRKAAEYIAEMGYKVYCLEMPATTESETARFYWQSSIKEFAAALQKITGKKITSSKLQKAIHKTGLAAKAFREIHRLRASNPPVITGTDALLVNNSYFVDDIESWTEAAMTLSLELLSNAKKEKSVCNHSAPRFILTGSPSIFPNYKIPMIVEQSGGIVVADEFCTSTRFLYDAVTFSEPKLYDLLPALADRYLKACTCPCLSPNDNRLRKIKEMIRTFNPDGIIYQAFSGCLPYEMEQKKISDMLSGMKMPMLYLETDYGKEDLGQISTRVEAFIESVQARILTRNKVN